MQMAPVMSQGQEVILYGLVYVLYYHHDNCANSIHKGSPDMNQYLSLNICK